MEDPWATTAHLPFPSSPEIRKAGVPPIFAFPIMFYVESVNDSTNDNAYRRTFSDLASTSIRWTMKGKDRSADFSRAAIAPFSSSLICSFLNFM